jgi:putative addiction module CopG family antidote
MEMPMSVLAEPLSAMSLNIPPEFERAVLERVASGAYGSTDEVLLACLAALEDEERQDEARLESLRHDVRLAMEQHERGEYSPLDEAFARIRERLARSAAP